MRRISILTLLALLFAAGAAAQIQHDGVNARQKSANPTVIGDRVWPGTTSGLCTPPGTAPEVSVTFSPSSPNTSTVGTGTWYVVYTIGNRNGETTPSPETSFVVSSGQAPQMGARVDTDLAFLTGCPKMRFYVSATPGGPYWLQTPWTRKVNLATITRASNVVTATVTGQHGLVPTQTVTIASVTCGGGGACTNSFNGTFTLTRGTIDPVTGNGTLEWTQSGANESGDAGVGQAQDNNRTIETTWHEATTLYGNRGAIYNTAFATSGSNPPSTNTAVIDPLQVAINRARNLSARSQTMTVVLPEQYAPTLTTGLVTGLSRIEGVSASQLQQGGAYPTITATWNDRNYPVVHVMAQGAEFEGVNFTTSQLNTPTMKLQSGTQTLNGFSFKKGYLGGSTSASATAPVLWMDAMPITFGAVLEEMNTIGGKTGILANNSIMALFTIRNSRINCGAVSGGSAIETYGGPDNPDRSNDDGDGKPIVEFYFDNSVTESCKGVQVYLTGGGVTLDHNSGFADPLTEAGVEAITVYRMDFWANGGQSSGYRILNGSSMQGSNNARAGIKTYAATNIIADNGTVPVGYDGSTNHIWLDAVNTAPTIDLVNAGKITCDLDVTASVNAMGIIVNYSTTGTGRFRCEGVGDRDSNTLHALSWQEGLKGYWQNTQASGASQCAWYEGVPRNQTSFNFYGCVPSDAANLWFQINKITGGFQQRWWKAGVAGGLLFEIFGDGTNFRFNFGNVSGFSNNALNVQNNWPLRFSNAANNATAVMINRNASDQGVVCQAAAGCLIGPNANTGLVMGFLTGTATLDFASITAPNCASDLTITVTGAADGDTVKLGVPNGSRAAGVVFDAWVSSTNTVTVRACAFTGTPDPASGSFRATIIKF